MRVISDRSRSADDQVKILSEDPFIDGVQIQHQEAHDRVEFHWRALVALMMVMTMVMTVPILMILAVTLPMLVMTLAILPGISECEAGNDYHRYY